MKKRGVDLKMRLAHALAFVSLSWVLLHGQGQVLGIFRTYGACVYAAPTDRAWSCVKKMGLPEVTEIRTWGAHERIAAQGDSNDVEPANEERMIAKPEEPSIGHSISRIREFIPLWAAATREGHRFAKQSQQYADKMLT